VSRLRYRPKALAEIDEIWSFYAARDIDAADRLIDEIRTAALRLIQHPRSAPERYWLPHGWRGLSVRSHIVVYHLEVGLVSIERVLDARRDLMAAMR
jgi:plasmid stabilization system protein ParE